MPTFNPNFPLDHSDAKAVEMRNQLNALNDKADAALQPGSNVSQLANDAGYLTDISGQTAGAVTSLAGHSTSELSNNGTGGQYGFTTADQVQDLIAHDNLIPFGSGVSGLVNDAGYLTDISGQTAGAVSSLAGHAVSELSNDAGYMANPMSGAVVGDMIYNIWSDTSPGAVMNARLPIGTPGQILAAVPGWQNGTGVFPGWVDNTALQPNPTADGTYPIANDGVTSGQLTGLTIKNGLITAVTVVP